MNIKTPITYYGGKQMMLRHILPLLPKHNLYCEPFVGGGAVYWGKEPSRVEVINDTNGQVMNFYEQVKSNFYKLKLLVDATLHSRKTHDDAKVIYENPTLFTPLKRAWAFWVLSNQSFSASIGNGWGYERKTEKTSKQVRNKKKAFKDVLTERLELTQIECNDALIVIKSRDSEDSFFYVDPPYHNSNCGHYKGYRESDFKALLECLSNLKGKFLLSSYLSDILKGYIEANEWHSKKIEMSRSAGKTTGRKQEMLTANYEIL